MIGCYVHHHGSGHVMRSGAVAEALRRTGEEVTGLSSEPPPPSWTGPWITLPRDDEPGPTRASDVTAGGALHWAPLRHDGYGTRMSVVAAWVRRARPTAFVVDVSVEVTLLVRLLGVPTVVMAMRGRRDDPAHTSAYDAATALVAPWPGALPEEWWPTRWRAKAHHVGAISRFDARVGESHALLGSGPMAEPTGRAPKGLLLWGRGGTEQPGLEDLQAALPTWSWHLPTPGQDLWADLLAADVVVCHAGQNAVAEVAEVAAARRPAVVVADHRPFAEQVHTVAALARGRLAATARTWPSREEWPALVATAQQLGGDGWESWSDGGGAGRAAEAIRGVARDGAGADGAAGSRTEDGP